MGVLCRLAPLVALSRVALATDLTSGGLDLPDLVLPDFDSTSASPGGESQSLAEQRQKFDANLQVESAPQFESRRTCGANPACSHLAGNCCPSDGGLVLDCCHESHPSLEDPAQARRENARAQFFEAPSQFPDVPFHRAGSPMPPTYASPEAQPLYQYMQTPQPQQQFEQSRFQQRSSPNQVHYDRTNALGVKVGANTGGRPNEFSQFNAPNDFIWATRR